MINELNKDMLFKFSLSAKAKFHLQRNTIITWKESNDLSDDNLALSFQDSQGVNDIWRLITAIKGKDAEQIKDLNDDITVDNLPFIAREIQPTADASKLKAMLNKIKHHDFLFIKQLGRLLEEEERRFNEEKVSYCSINTNASSTANLTHTNTTNDQGGNEEKKMPGMAFIFLIIKNIILMSDSDLLERLMSDSLYNIIFGALEYDFETQRAIKHRLYLNETAKFNNIIRIKDRKVIEKIQVNYRLTYLRDTVLARFLEVNGFTVVNKIIQINNTDIIQAFLLNKEYIDDIINQLLSNDLNIQNKAIMFIVELMNCSKELFQQRLTHFQELLFQSGLLQTIEFLLIKNSELILETKMLHQSYCTSNPDEDIIRNNILGRSIEIVSDFIIYLPYLLKDYLVNSTSLSNETEDDPHHCDGDQSHNRNKDNCLLFALIILLKNTKDSGIKNLIGQIIKLFINANQDLNINQESIIFTKCLNELASFLSYDPPDNDPIERSSIVATKQIIIDILSYCLNQLKDHMQYWFIHNSIITKVLQTINDKSKVLTVSVVKFARFVIETNNYNYQKTLMLSECFDEIFCLFKLNKHKDNLLLATIMSFFDSIIKSSGNGNSILIETIVKNYSEIIYDKGNENFFGNLIKRYELGKEFGNISRNESMAFHGLFSREQNSSKEEEYDGIDGMVYSNTNSNANAYATSNERKETINLPLLSTLSFVNLNETYLLESNKSSTCSFLNKKRSPDPL